MPRDLPTHDAPEWLRYAVERTLPSDGSTGWVPTGAFETSSLVRVPRFPDEIDETATRTLALDAVRNERRSGQLAVAATDPIENLTASLTWSGGSPIRSTVRFVGYVPVERALVEREGFPTVEEVAGAGVSGDRAPDVVGDPLVERDALDVPPYRAQPIWLSIDVPADAPPGTHEGTVTISADDGEIVEYDLAVTVHDAVLPDPSDYDFHLDVWANPSAIAAEYDLDPWSERHWERIDAYLADLASRGQSVIAAPIVHEPWQREWLDGTWRSQTWTGYASLVSWRHDGEWRFDYSRFDRYVETALEAGVGPQIAAYSMLVFRGPQRLTYRDGAGDRVVERTQAGSERWREAWRAFLRDFSAHLDERGWRDRTMLAFDERPPEQMDEALDLIEEVAPEFDDRIQIAGSIDVEPYADDLSVHYGHLPLGEGTIAERRADDRITTFYVAPAPAHPNTFSYSPAVESRQLPWIAAGNGLDGMLRWAYNSWPRDVFADPVFRYGQGGEYLVYPGEDGPASSVRWELLLEGIQEYELARLVDDPDARERAFALATRDHDGREKALGDLPSARRILLDALD